MSRHEQIGRLAMRVEGDWWVAYYAQLHTMEGALILGRIRMAIVAKRRRKDEFMLLMKGAIADLLSGAGIPEVAKLSIAKMGISQNVGASNGGAKLTVNQVREARVRLAAGESQRSIARSFGIHFDAIWKIANGLTWRSVA